MPYLLLLWDFGVRPLRRMTADGVNADFFDVQARALFHGNLDVPPGSLGIEAFVVDGRHYMYFGPFLALLRMPVLLVTDRLDGRLTALSMLVGWFVLAAAVIVLVRQVRRRLRGDAAVGRFEAVGLAAVVATVTGGSTVVYLASQPWVYHEVYIWSTALTVATVASLIAAWDDPSGRRIVLTTALALATMLTRITAGWAMALALLVTGVWILVSRRPRRDAGRRAAWGLRRRRRRRGADRLARQLGEVPPPVPVPDRGSGVDTTQRPSPGRGRRQRREPRRSAVRQDNTERLPPTRRRAVRRQCSRSSRRRPIRLRRSATCCSTSRGAPAACRR